MASDRQGDGAVDALAWSYFFRGAVAAIGADDRRRYEDSLDLAPRKNGSALIVVNCDELLDRRDQLANAAR